MAHTLIAGRYEEAATITRSNFETNVFRQPEMIRQLLGSPRPSWMNKLKKRNIFFVGIGTSYHAAQIAAWLWRNHVSAKAHAVHSFDFVRIPQPIVKNDVAVLISHSGAKSFTLEAAALAKKKGAVTVGITRKCSSWESSLTHRLETCERENTGVHSKSMTTAIAWIIRWINSASLSKSVLAALPAVTAALDFPEVRANSDVLLIGDAVREWVAREISLKLQEAAYLPARPFGIEEFLHGPRISAGRNSIAVLLSSPEEKRWDSVRDYLETIEVPLHVVHPMSMKSGDAQNAGWLWQLFWGQRFTAQVCRNIGVNPDTMRTNDARYKAAKEKLSL